MPNYLSICALYRDEAPYLAEWIEFHLLVGVERFFLYNNRSEDEHAEVLAPYVSQGTVEVVDWPLWPGMKEAYADCVARHRTDSRWIGFIDVDEFLFSPRGVSLAEVLPGYERWPAVGVNWAQFGTSGHRTKPPGLVIENYLHRSNATWLNRWIKSIADPSRIERCPGTNHWFYYRDGVAVDENQAPIQEPFAATESVSFSNLRINHYRTKSEAEYLKRSELPWQIDRPRPRLPLGELDKMLNEYRDETILMYGPALRDALVRRSRETASAERSR